MASDLDLTYLNELTREYIEAPEVYDQVFESATTLDVFRRAGMVETGKDVGIEYQWMIRESLPSGPVPYSGYDTFDLTAPDLFDRVHLDPHNYAQTLSIPKDRLDANRGSKTKLADLIEEVLKAGVEQFSVGLNQDIYNRGTDSDRIVGLRAAVAEDRSYAGINSATTGNEFWDAMYDDTDVANRTLAKLQTTTEDNFIFNLMDRAMILLKQKGQDPKNYICMCTMGFAQAFMHSVRHPYLQVGMGDLKRPDYSVVNLYHQGIPITPDVDCPVGPTISDTNTYSHNYFLNKKTTKLIFCNMYGGGSKKAGIFEWGGWKDMAPIQETIAGNLKCRALLVTKQPGVNLDIVCASDVVSEITL